VLQAERVGRDAEAAFPGQNGKIAFASDRDGNAEIYAMNPDGTGQINLTNNPKQDSDPEFTEVPMGKAFSESS
jgi:Tol biopolymer transport system component